MTSFVYDFKDIASRMKGELKATPEPEPEPICPHCLGSGERWSALLQKYVDCGQCKAEKVVF